MKTEQVLEFAKRHFVTVVPGIEMPGHVIAALSIYPEPGAQLPTRFRFQQRGCIMNLHNPCGDKILLRISHNASH